MESYCLLFLYASSCLLSSNILLEYFSASSCDIGATVDPVGAGGGACDDYDGRGGGGGGDNGLDDTPEGGGCCILDPLPSSILLFAPKSGDNSSS